MAEVAADLEAAMGKRGGVAEGPRNVPLQWSLSISPNPARGAFSVRYDVPSQSRVSVGVYDACGSLFWSLSDCDVVPSRYGVNRPSGTLPAGGFFCTLTAANQRFSRKVILTE